MTAIQIKVGELVDYLSLVTCMGKTEEGKSKEKVVREFIMDVLPDRQAIKTVGTDKACKVFVQVEQKCHVLEPGKIVVGDADMLEKYLSAFNMTDTITVRQESGYIVLTRDNPKKVARFITVTEENIETRDTAKMLDSIWQFNDEFAGNQNTKLTVRVDTTAEQLQNIIKDSEIVSEERYPFVIMKGEDGKYMLKVEVGNIQIGIIKSMIQTTLIKTDKDINNIYAYGFDSVVNVVSGKLKIFTEQNKPLWILMENEKVKAKYMLAPCVE